MTSRAAARQLVLLVAIVVALSLSAAGAWVVLGVRVVEAHGNPEVHVEPNPAVPGGEVTIEGEGFEEESEVSVVLEGLMGEITLGNVTTDAEGKFRFSAVLPDTALAGSYRIRAVGAEDGATADLHIEEGEGGVPPVAEQDLTIDFHRIDSAAVLMAFALLAAVMVLVAVPLLFLAGRTKIDLDLKSKK